VDASLGMQADWPLPWVMGEQPRLLQVGMVPTAAGECLGNKIWSSGRCFPIFQPVRARPRGWTVVFQPGEMVPRNRPFPSMGGKRRDDAGCGRTWEP